MKMLDFIYDSLDTVKKLKFPTWKQIGQLTLGIFVLVLIAGGYFVFADTLFADGYKMFYAKMTGQEVNAAVHSHSGEDQVMTLSGVEAILSGANLEVTGAEFATGVELSTGDAQ